MASRRKKRGPPSPPAGDLWDRLYPTLDLHGATGDEAVRRAERWLREQQGGDEPRVRIITGWGRHSIGPPVLRTEIDALLSRLRGSLVERFELEPGGGAFRIDLRRRASRLGRPQPVSRSSAAPHRPSPSAETAELRRAAEEALWELGITPTPELLRAEIERLRDARNAKDD
jgi:hypothetical protein